MTKNTPKKFASKIAAAMHETMADLHEIGLIDKKTMRKFDAMCLTTIDQFSASDIARLRDSNGVCQGVFARYLNVRPKLVSEWERGVKKPSGPSLKLLSLVKAKGLEAIL